jgi:outer membrane protein with beta-barrel domain
MSKKLLLLSAAVMMMVVGGVAPAAAGQPHLELYAGYYVPGQSAFDDDLTFGLRFGGRPTERFGWQVSGGVFDLNGEEDRPLQGRVGDANAFLVDASFQWFPGGGNFAVFGGPGFSSIDIDHEGSTQDTSDDTFTLHIGASYLFQIGESFYLRPDVRFRDFQGDVYDKTDTEASLAFGWNF